MTGESRGISRPGHSIGQVIPEKNQRQNDRKHAYGNLLLS